MNLLPHDALARLRAEYEAADANREDIIKTSRGLLKDAKRVISLVHQDALKDATELLETLRDAHAPMRADPQTRSVGAYTDALEEYVEAACVLAVAQGKTVPTPEKLGVPCEAYLGGLADATGELARRAVHAATRHDAKTVDRLYAFINAVEEELVQLSLRNGTLRKKYDAVKYHVRKVEELRYDMRRDTTAARPATTGSSDDDT